MGTGRSPAYHERAEQHSVQHTDISSGDAAAVGASRQVVGGAVHELCGFALAETTGAAGAAVRLRDGAGPAARVFCRVNLLAGESDREWWTRPGLECYSGRIFLEWISGSVEGVVYWR